VGPESRDSKYMKSTIAAKFSEGLEEVTGGGVANSTLNLPFKSTQKTKAEKSLFGKRKTGGTRQPIHNTRMNQKSQGKGGQSEERGKWGKESIPTRY